MAETRVGRQELEKIVREILGGEIAGFVRENMEEVLKPLRDHQNAMVQRMLMGVGGAGGLTPEQERAQKGQTVSRMILAIAAGKGDPDRMIAYATKQWGADAEVTKALGTSTGDAGGFIVPQQYATEIIEYLRPASVVRALGPIVIPMPTGSMRIPKQTGGSAASYVGENTNTGVTQPTFGQIVLSFKKLMAVVPVGNDLIRYSNPGIDAIVRTDLVRAMAQRENQAFISDDGSVATPKGLRFWANAGNVAASAGTWVANLANQITDLGNLILALRNNNVPMSRPAWIMNPTEWNRLMTIQTTTGAFVFRDEMVRGTLWGYPFGVTTQVAGAPGTASGDFYLADFDDVAIGEAQTLVLDASMEAAYWDGAQVVSAFSQDQTVVRAIAEHDLAVRRDVSVAVRTGITA